jgi:hypothetical protein
VGLSVTGAVAITRGGSAVGAATGGAATTGFSACDVCGCESAVAFGGSLCAGAAGRAGSGAG